MAHQTEIVVNGQTVEVTEFDHTAQEIDDMCDAAQSILPDGPGLPVSQGGTGATNQQAALAALGAGVRPNIARNPAFAVNQRNFTSDNWTSGYGPDGWDSVGIGYLTFNGSTICCYGQYICQRYEAGVIKKGKYTVSALCDGQIIVVMGYWGSEITANATSTNYQNGIASVTLDIPSDNDEAMGYIYIRTATSGGEITYVKIEQGSTQTLAYQDSTGAWQLLPQPESDYATQLAKCQRYLLMGPIHAPVWSLGYAFLPTPVTIRANPAIIGEPAINSVESNTAHPDAIAAVAGIVNNGVLFSLQNVAETCYLYFPAGSGISCEL